MVDSNFTEMCCLGPDYKYAIICTNVRLIYQHIYVSFNADEFKISGIYVGNVWRISFIDNILIDKNNLGMFW